MLPSTESDSSKYQEFLGYMFRFYLTEDHKYGILHKDHFTDIQNGDMDGTNNASESINRSLKKFSSCGAKSLKTVFRSIYNFKIDNSKRMLCATIQRKRPEKTIEKFDKINEILSEFDNLQPDLQISSLCSTLERLGSL